MPITLQREQHVAVITLDAPESLNALTIDDLADLRQTLRDLQDDDTIRALVLTGAGQRAFCTGANLKATHPPKHSFAHGQFRGRSAEAGMGGYTRLIDLSDLEIWKPVIAAVNGHCMGGGLELALQCDLRIASEHASFALPEVSVASVPAAGGVQLLLRAIPAAHAMKMALTGTRINAEEALRIGLVSDLVAAEELHSAAMVLAERIAANGPLAVQAVKRLAVETAHLAPRDFIAHSNLQWGLLRNSRDRVEGRNAFGEKRKPRYTGE